MADVGREKAKKEAIQKVKEGDGQKSRGKYGCEKLSVIQANEQMKRPI